MDVLGRTHEAILLTLHGLDAGQLRRRAPGGWSALELVEHVVLNERRVAELLASAGDAEAVEGPPPAPPLAHLLVRTRHVEAPERLRPAGTLTSLQDARGALDQSGRMLAERYAALDAATLDRRGVRDPVFGPMTLRQCHELCVLHGLRHLAQLHEIVAAA